MLRNVDVPDAPPIMTDDEAAVEHAERNRGHREEIHGGNHFPMFAKQSQPALGVVGISRRSLHPTGDGSLGKLKTEHTEFPMDRGGPQLGFATTIRKINSRTSFGDGLLPTCLRTLEISRQKTSPVPTDYGFGCDDEERVLPIRPDSPGDYPEELIDEVEARGDVDASA